MEKEVAVRVSNVSKKYGNLNALDFVSFEIEKNTIFGLLGSNGAGKSTMAHILTGLLSFKKGIVEILGERLWSSYSRSLKRRVAIVPQQISLYDDLTIYDNLSFFGKAYGLRRKEILARIRNLDYMLNLGDLNRKIKNLSGGYQRRVSIAVALIGDPELLIMDEALVGIDLETRSIIIKFLRELKKTKTIIFTTHSMSEAEELCDYVCFLHKGKKVMEGKTEELIENFAINHNSKIKIIFRDTESALKVKKLLREEYGVSLSNRTLEIESSSAEYNVSNMIRFLEKIRVFRGDIRTIEIIKPSLGEIFLDVIKKEGL